MRLIARDIFFLAAAQVYEDGRADPHETELLMELRARFGLTREAAAELMREARAFSRGEGEPIDVDELFARCCRVALMDDLLEAQERALLLELAELLGIGPQAAEHRLDTLLRSAA